jgi:hypothetical protein
MSRWYLLQRLLPKRLLRCRTALPSVSRMRKTRPPYQRGWHWRGYERGAENTTTLASACEDNKGFVPMIALLVGELTVEHRAREVSERERQEQFEELTLLWAQSSEVCHTIVSPRWAMHDLFEGMWLAALCHTEMAGELATLGAAVSSTTESVLF